MKNETCSNCGAVIGALETPRVWNDQVVCGACEGKLRGNVLLYASPHETPTPSPVVYVQPTGGGGSGLGVASLVLGLLGLCLVCIPPLAILLSIIGVVLGLVGVLTTGRGIAIAGLIVSGLPFVLGILALFGFVILGTSH